MRFNPFSRPSVQSQRFAAIDLQLLDSLTHLLQNRVPASIILSGKAPLRFRATEAAGDIFGTGQGAWAVGEVCFTRTQRNDDTITISTQPSHQTNTFHFKFRASEYREPPHLLLKVQDLKAEIALAFPHDQSIGRVRIVDDSDQRHYQQQAAGSAPLDKTVPASETASLLGVNQSVHIALNIVWRKNPTTQETEYLLIQEAAGKRDAGLWYVPAGRIERNESVQQGAIREALEESGILIDLGDVIATETWRGGGFSKVRHIFSATPRFEQRPKSHSDEHSMGASWFTYRQIQKLPLRGQEILEYINGIEERGSRF